MNAIPLPGGSPWRGAWISMAVVFCASGVLGLFVNALGELFPAQPHSVSARFDSAAWKDPEWTRSATRETHMQTVRQCMSFDLCDRLRDQQGSSKELIEEWLGVSHDKWTAKDSGRVTWYYPIEAPGQNPIPGETFWVSFTAEGKFEFAGIERAD